MDIFNKYRTGIVATVVALAMGGGWLYDKGSTSKAEENNYQLIEGRIFETPQQMIRVVTKVEQLPTIEEVQRQKILDSIAGEAMKKNAEDAIRSRAARDKRDSLQAVTIYQIKEELKKQNN